LNAPPFTPQAGQSVIGLQYGSNKGASQAGMTPYGASRQIRPEGTYHGPNIYKDTKPQMSAFLKN
jgi:hypothetical protein